MGSLPWFSRVSAQAWEAPSARPSAASCARRELPACAISKRFSLSRRGRRREGPAVSWCAVRSATCVLRRCDRRATVSCAWSGPPWSIGAPAAWRCAQRSLSVGPCRWAWRHVSWRYWGIFWPWFSCWFGRGRTCAAIRSSPGRWGRLRKPQIIAFSRQNPLLRLSCFASVTAAISPPVLLSALALLGRQLVDAARANDLPERRVFLPPFELFDQAGQLRVHVVVVFPAENLRRQLVEKGFERRATGVLDKCRSCQLDGA